ncbi:hypothetical protein NA57DRAFT_51146 [Rhizodiscina lignyota]|uniref:LysM domain-containing protein n=1 Tax=Rhizodiscina lignyota TaxID=1504668 RepID=A0A9P4IQN7_9PEZI|nr:hypothetical protein NA57DRAFT_51146 [Rhizodiscina lignyota]
MSSEACCTCASLLSSISPTYDEKSEKASPLHERRTTCCGRAICARCITDNPRFATYCPFCQISETPSSLPQGLRDPPAYSPPSSPPIANARGPSQRTDDDPPAYDTHDPLKPHCEKESEPAPDVLHFVNPAHDTVSSLSLRYGVPADALRRTNNLYSDHLILARRTILIPEEYYKGGRMGAYADRWSVAPTLRYDVALLYLKQADYDLDLAIEAYKEDERWEKEHPLQSSKGKGKANQSPRRRRHGMGTSLTGQIT